MAAVRFSSLGDVILTTGPLLWWHERCGTTFTVITKENFAPVFSGHPAVTSVITIGSAEKTAGAFMTFCREMAGRFKGLPLVDLHGSIRSRLLSLFWKGEVFRYPKMAMQRRLFLLSHGHAFKSRLQSSHVTLRYAAAIPPDVIWDRAHADARQTGAEKRIALPCHADVKPRVFLSREENEKAASLLGAKRKRRVVLHPYARHMAKSWSMETWAELARCLSPEYDIVWVGLGTPPENAPGLCLVNRTDLRTLAAVIAGCDLIVTGDSGPMHMAAAVGTPIVALFGPTCLEWGFYPGGRNVRILQHDMPCRPCSLHGNARCRRDFACLKEITVAEAADAARSLLDTPKDTQ